MGPIRLSLSMIVRDEAERLERCLASVAGFVDEMVLLDTGSRDATVAIADAPPAARRAHAEASKPSVSATVSAHHRS